MNYPLIILPQAIKDIITLQPARAPFTQTPPPKRNLTQPQPIEVGITTATLALGLTGAIVLIFAKQINLSILTVIAIASLIHQGKKSFPVRLKQYECDLAKYQKEQTAYEQAKQEWEQEQALINAPDGITKFRQMRLKKALSKVKDDGTAPNPNIGATEDYFLTILNQYFPDKIYLDRKIAIPDTDQHYSPDFAYIDTEYNLQLTNPTATKTKSQSTISAKTRPATKT